MQAVTLAMRERRHSSREIALAQKKLMNELLKASEEFVCFIDVAPFLEQLDMTLPETMAQVFSDGKRRGPVSDADLTYEG